MHCETFYAVFCQGNLFFFVDWKKKHKTVILSLFKKSFSKLILMMTKKNLPLFSFSKLFLSHTFSPFFVFRFLKKSNRNQIWQIVNRIHSTVERCLGANAAIIMDKYLSKDIWYTTHPTPTIILSFYAQKYSGDNHQQIEKWEEKRNCKTIFPSFSHFY